MATALQSYEAELIRQEIRGGWEREMIDQLIAEGGHALEYATDGTDTVPAVGAGLDRKLRELAMRVATASLHEAKLAWTLGADSLTAQLVSVDADGN